MNAFFRFGGSGIISRSKGQSAIAAAAYRSGECLHDERTDETKDYSNRTGVLYSEILAPEGAPEWINNREKLWNAVEAAEHRKDSQLAREIQLAMPNDLRPAEQVAVVREFVQERFVSHGMIADLAFHSPDDPDGKNFHFHVMLTMRHIGDDGFSAKKADWNELFATFAKEKNVTRGFVQDAKLMEHRKAFADHVNRALERNGLSIRVDHRSYADQGLDIEPQPKIGTTASEMENNGQSSERANLAREVARENGKRIAHNPNIAIDALTCKQSTFTRQDIARFLSSKTDGAEQFTDVMALVSGHENVVYLGKDDHGQQRFSSREMVQLERKMMATASVLSDRSGHSTGIIDRVSARFGKGLTPDQRAAFDYMTSKGDLKNVVGFAGAGKSYTLGAARVAWEGSGRRVRGLTLAGVAAENLKNEAGIESRTIASQLRAWERGYDALGKDDVLVIDEAGMVPSRQMARILDEAQKANAKVVLIGDPKQLPAIEAGAAFRAIAEKTHYIEINGIRRQREDWQREATRAFGRGEAEKALDAYDNNGLLKEYETRDHAKAAVVNEWRTAKERDPTKTQLMLAYRRIDVADLNNKARAHLKESGELGPEKTFSTHQGDRMIAEGERIYFLQNDRQLGVSNGTIGMVECIRSGLRGDLLTVRLDDKKGTKVEFDQRRYNAIDYGYAATVHKAQGATVDRTYVLADRYYDRNSSYVALSRHRETVTVHWDRETFRHTDHLKQTMARIRDKDTTLDYYREEVKRKGSEKSKDRVAFNTVKAYSKAAKAVRLAYSAAKSVADKDGVPIHKGSMFKNFEHARNERDALASKIARTGGEPFLEEFKLKPKVVKQEALTHDLLASAKAYKSFSREKNIQKCEKMASHIVALVAHADNKTTQRIKTVLTKNQISYGAIVKHAKTHDVRQRVKNSNSLGKLAKVKAPNRGAEKTLGPKERGPSIGPSL